MHPAHPTRPQARYVPAEATSERLHGAEHPARISTHAREHNDAHTRKTRTMYFGTPVLERDANEQGAAQHVQKQPRV